MASLYVNGVDLDWAAMDAPYSRTFITLPNYPFQRKTYRMELSPNRINTKSTPNTMPEMIQDSPVEEHKPMNQTERHPIQPVEDQKHVVLSTLIQLLAAIGGFAPNDIDPHSRLMEMSLDSLMLFKMGQEAEQLYQTEFKVSQFFNEIKSLNDLADYIIKHGVVQPAPSQPDAMPRHSQPSSGICWMMLFRQKIFSGY